MEIGRTFACERALCVDAFMRANRPRRWPIFVVVEFRVRDTFVNVSARFIIVGQFEAIGTHALEAARQILAVLATSVALLAFVDIDAIVRLVHTETVAARFNWR